MSRAPFPKGADALWAKHDAEWRHPAQAVSLWRGAANTDRRLLKFEISGPFWDLLDALGVTLFLLPRAANRRLPSSTAPFGDRSRPGSRACLRRQHAKPKSGFRARADHGVGQTVRCRGVPPP